MKKATEARRHALAVNDALAEEYPVAQCALHHKNAFELTAATILSAQCTDARVNLTTPALFKRFPNAEALAEAPQEELEGLIKSTGFFRAKSKSLLGMARAVALEHGGQIPRDLDALVKLPGVGRKTANVVLGVAYGIPSGVVVDTHVGRNSVRLGLTKQTDPIKVERDLMALLPESAWIDFSHRMILHGRAICKARRPECERCPLATLCPRIGVNSGPSKRTSKAVAAGPAKKVVRPASKATNPKKKKASAKPAPRKPRS